MAKSKSTAMNLSSHVPTSSSSSKNSDSIQKSGDSHSYEEIQNPTLEFSSATARGSYFGGLMDTATGKPVAAKDNQVLWIFPNLKPGVFMKRKHRGNLLITKQLQRNLEHPAIQKTREILMMKERKARNFTHVSSHSDSHGCSILDRKKIYEREPADPVEGGYLWHIPEYHSSSSSSSWSRL